MSTYSRFDDAFIDKAFEKEIVKPTLDKTAMLKDLSPVKHRLGRGELRAESLYINKKESKK